ncbi:phosphotransferase [Glycomyces albus]
MEHSEVLQDGPHRRVERFGNSVHRPAMPWTATIHRLLDHLRSVGFDLAPRPLGFDGLGREVLTFIDGESGPAGWAKVTGDRGLTTFAHVLRDYHQAVAEFRPPPGSAWADGTGTTGEGEIVCHGDFGPWNLVWRGDRPVGLIDWDYAGPAPAIRDLAWALQFVAPFRDDAECLRWLRYERAPDRRRRIELFCAAYGLDSTDGIVDAVIQTQRDGIDLVRRLAAQGRQPQADWVANGVLDELDRRLDWSVANRSLFE